MRVELSAQSTEKWTPGRFSTTEPYTSLIGHISQYQHVQDQCMNIRAHISTIRGILVQKNLDIVGGCVSACCGKEWGSVSAWGTATQCILVSFQSTCQSTLQFKEGRVCFGSWFEGTVHHGGKAWQPGWEVAGHTAFKSGKQRALCWWSAHLLPSSQSWPQTDRGTVMPLEWSIFPPQLNLIWKITQTFPRWF